MEQPTSPLLVIIGPSGSGKSSVVRLLAQRQFLRVHPTWTTRPRRDDEGDGSVEHRFVDDASFDALVAAGSFLDTVSLFGLPYRYGLPPIRRSTDGRTDTIMLRAPLVERFHRVVGGPSVVIQIEDEPARLVARLGERASSADDVRCRIDEAIAGRSVADHVLVNDGSLEALADSVLAALVAYTKVSL